MATVHYKKCPRCGQPAVLDMRVCQRCGHVYRSAPPDRTQFFGPGEVAPATLDCEPSPQVALIVLMWLLKVVDTGTFLLFGLAFWPVCVLLEIGGLVLSICLAGSRNRVDRINGIVSLCLMAVGLVLSFLVGLLSGLAP